MKVINLFHHIIINKGGKYEASLGRWNSLLIIQLKRKNRRGEVVFEKTFYFEALNENIHILRCLRNILGRGKIRFRIVGSGKFKFNDHLLEITQDTNYHVFMIRDKQDRILYREIYHLNTPKQNLPINLSGYTLNDVRQLYKNLLEKYEKVAKTMEVA